MGDKIKNRMIKGQIKKAIVYMNEGKTHTQKSKPRREKEMCEAGEKKRWKRT